MLSPPNPDTVGGGAAAAARTWAMRLITAVASISSAAEALVVADCIP